MTLEFIPHQGILTDFLITTRDNPTLRNNLQALGAHVIEKDEYTAYVWNESLGDCFFIGLGVVNNKLLVGPRRIRSGYHSLGAGSYVLVDMTGPQAIVEPDPFGMHVIYAGKELITNRLHLAALAVGEVDVEAALASTYNEGVFSFSFNTFASPVKGVSILAAGDRAYVGNQVRILSDSYESDFLTGEPEDYWRLIELGASEIISNVEALLNSGLPIICDITGGRDSRIVLGALVATGRVQEVQFNTNIRNTSLSRDLEIGSGLVKIFGGKYSVGPSPIGYAQHSVGDNLKRRRSQLFGAYHFITEGNIRPVTSLGHGFTIRMLGGGGELYRDYYQDLFSSVSHAAISTVENTREMFFNHHGSVYADKLLKSYVHHFQDTFRHLPGRTIDHKLDAHYLNFRNRFHFGSRQSTPSSIHSINPATSQYLLRAARSLPLEEKSTGRVLFDVIRTFDEKLAYLPFDKPIDPKVFDSRYHRPSVFEGSNLHLEPATELAMAPSSRYRPIRPMTPEKKPFSFVEVLNREIRESLDILSRRGSQFSHIVDDSLKNFITYAQNKSPRHHAALSSRLRAYADYEALTS